MSVIGKKLTPIQASGGGGGHSDENTAPTNDQPSKITPDDILRLTTITDDYLCSSGWNFVVVRIHTFYRQFQIVWIEKKRKLMRTHKHIKIMSENIIP